MSSSYVRRTCLDANTLRSATFVGSELHSFELGATVTRFFNCIGTGAKVQGTGSESSRERKFHLWYFRSWERKYVGTKVPQFLWIAGGGWGGGFVLTR